MNLVQKYICSACAGAPVISQHSDSSNQNSSEVSKSCCLKFRWGCQSSISGGMVLVVIKFIFLEGKEKIYGEMVF